MLINNFQNIELMGSDGKSHKLSKYKGKYVVLYFYPKDNTFGCSIQGAEYSKLASDFAKNNAIVLGVSKGSVDSKVQFCQSKHFNHILLADEKLELSKAFNVTKPGLFGKEESIIRSSFIVSPTSKIISERVGVNFKGDALENLQFIMSIKEEN